jgi:hypothetical protein
MTCLKPETAKPGSAGPDGLDFNPAAAMSPRAPGQTPADARNGARVKANDLAPEGDYLPNYNILTPHMRSPDYVQMSTAAAITLGITSGKMYRCACTRCLNLLLTYPEGCRANCAYCGLARHREAERDYADRNFIRVDWPAVPLERVIEIVAADGAATPFHRMCISMITHPRSDADTVEVMARWTAAIPPDVVPVSILSNPTTMERDDVGPTSSRWRSMRRRRRSSSEPAARAFSRPIAGPSTGRSSSMPATSSARENLAPTSSSAWGKASSTSCSWSSSWWTWAATATCSASFRRRDP